MEHWKQYVILAILFGSNPNAQVFDKFLYQPHFPWEMRYNHFYGIGNLSMSKIFLLPTKEEMEQFALEIDDDEGDEIDDEKHDSLPKDFPILEESLDTEGNFFDSQEYDKIRDELRNMSNVIKGFRTRRYSSCRYWYCYPSYVDADDYPRNLLWWEKFKIQRVNNFTLSFLIHMRFKVREAIKVRELVKTDKRFQLGYLFNRIRRLAYDQRKIYTAMSFVEKDYKFRKIYRTMRFYKMLLRYEVDIKDTIAFLKDIYYNVEDPPLVTTERKKRREKTTTAPSTLSVPKTSTIQNRRLGGFNSIGNSSSRKSKRIGTKRPKT